MKSHQTSCTLFVLAGRLRCSTRAAHRLDLSSLIGLLSLPPGLSCQRGHNYTIQSLSRGRRRLTEQPGFTSKRRTEIQNSSDCVFSQRLQQHSAVQRLALRKLHRSRRNFFILLPSSQLSEKKLKGFDQASSSRPVSTRSSGLSPGRIERC